MKNFTFILVSIIAFAGLADYSTPIYGSLTSIAQLEQAPLDRGQFAYYEQDGAIELFCGAKDENKELRVCDPAALSGYRICEFDSELTVDYGDKLIIDSNGEYKFVIADHQTPDYTKYIQCSTNQVSVSWRRYYTYDGTTYTIVQLPENTQLSDQYYVAEDHWTIILKIYSKDHEIYQLFFDQHEKPRTLGDPVFIKTEDSIEYDGRVATLTRDVTSDRPSNSDWFSLYNFRATTLALGDRIHATDLESTKIIIKDREWYDSGAEAKRNRRLDHLNYYSEFDDPEGFDLSEVRYWAKHLYDGNRGEDWSKYVGTHDVVHDTYTGTKFKSPRFINGITNSWKIIPMDGHLMINTGVGLPFIKLESYTEDSTGGDSNCVVTAIHQNSSTHKWELEFSFLNAVEPDNVMLLWRPTLEHGDWCNISCDLTYNNAKTEYTATIPLAYTDIFTSGFWKIYVIGDISERRVRIDATITLRASDGKYYKLTFPSGGGTVTATLDDNQGY